MAATSLMDTLFQRTLEDLIKGLRQAGNDTAFISRSVEEIRREIKSTDVQTKSIALQKLSYLNTLHGVDMSWAAFHAVECISSSSFSNKKAGYQAITQSFSDSTSVILLITNQLRKDLTSTNSAFEVSMALECLARIATIDLARELTPEIFTLLSSSKIIVRKRAISLVLRVFEKYPDAVRVCFKRLVENLDNSDQQVMSTVVGVFCELVSKDPQTYLPLAPEFYRILVDSKNNWVLIKVLKIFANLVPSEPRLAKRVVDPICEHMRRTSAKSLLFECIMTVVTSLTEYEFAVKLAVTNIKEFLVDADSNLKYLGLHSLSVLAPNHLWAVLENKEAVIKSLSDSDPNIKLGSLHLVMSMVSESNLSEISRVLVAYALKSDPIFCNEILGAVLSTCGHNVYEIIMDFDWYVSLLGEMSRIPHCKKGEEIENQLIDIGMRVKDARPELVRVCRELLIDPALLGNNFLHRVLCAAAWVSGEYIELATNPFELMEALLQPRTSLLVPLVRSVYVHSTLKILAFCVGVYVDQKKGIGFSDLSDVSTQSDGSSRFTRDSILDMLNLIELNLAPLTGSREVELQERTRNVLAYVDLATQIVFSNSDEEVGAASKIINVICNAFSEKLGPVSVNSQEIVSLPVGLVLKENLGDLDSVCGDIAEPSLSSEKNVTVAVSSPLSKEETEPSTESTFLLTEHRKRHGLYYLSSDRNGSESHDYPPANDLKSHDLDADDLAKLTAQSLVPKKKSSHTRTRPVVVKLEGDEAHIIAKKQNMKDNSLSDRVHNALQSTNDKGKKKLDCGPEPKETSITGAEKQQVGNSSKTRRKNRTKNDGQERDEVGPKEKRKSSKHKALQKTEEPSGVVIPDFLL